MDLSTHVKSADPGWVDIWARDTARWYWSADTLFWQLSIDHNIDVQSVFSWAPKVAWCGRTVSRADGRAVGVRSRDYQIFSDG